MNRSGDEDGSRVRRATRVSRVLERARERNNRQLVVLREREQRVELALREYVAATEQVAAVEHSFEDRLSRLAAKMDEVRAERDSRLGDTRDARARAVFAIHDAGRTVKQVADLLELSEKAARQLIGQGRTVASAETGGGRGPSPRGRARPRGAVVPTVRCPPVGDDRDDEADHGERHGDGDDGVEFADGGGERQHGDPDAGTDEQAPGQVRHEPAPGGEADQESHGGAEHGQHREPGKPGASGHEHLARDDGDEARYSDSEVRAEGARTDQADERRDAGVPHGS